MRGRMRIVGVDPGISVLGYAVLDHDGRSAKGVDYGALRFKEFDQDAILEIYRFMKGLCEEAKPDYIAIEQIFVHSNQITALKVGQIMGVIWLIGAELKIPVVHYTPMEVKQAVAGYGKAPKEQVQRMVAMILGLESIPRPDDVADAIAVAICHANMVSSAEAIRSIRTGPRF